MFAPRAGPALLVTGLLELAAGADLLVRPPPSYAPEFAGLLAVAVGAWVFLAIFFRDPERSPLGEIVSPADGRVQFVRPEGEFLRIAVFMNVTDVHVNRFPMDARVESVAEAGRGHAPAYAPRAGANVQREYRLSTAVGPVRVVQITGFLARRLISFVRPGESHARAERLGMIALGSRVDLLLPRDRVEPLVSAGDRVWAGRTAVARIGA